MVQEIFTALLIDTDGTDNVFETDQTKTTTPTLGFYAEPSTVIDGLINRVHWRINPTNAVTYDFWILTDAQADDYASESLIVFSSEDTAGIADCADNTEYIVEGLEIPFHLSIVGYFYYLIDWSAAPGNTPGYLKIEGRFVGLGGKSGHGG